VARLVIQSRASSPSPMSSRATTLRFWYVVFLSENQTSPAPEKKGTQLLSYSLIPKPCTKNQFFGQGLGSGYVILIRKAICSTKPLALSDKKNDTKKY